AKFFNRSQTLVLALFEIISVMALTTYSALMTIEFLRICFAALSTFIRRWAGNIALTKRPLLEIQPVLAQPVTNVGGRCAEQFSHRSQTETLLDQRLKN